MNDYQNPIKVEGFWSMIDRTGDCWNWIQKSQKAYWNGRTTHPFRIAYVLTHGVPPCDYPIRHICGNSLCCNPQHLFLSTPENRLWRLVIKSDGCWEWIGCKSGCGYGMIRWDGKTQQVHRVVWSLVLGPIPSDMLVCHHCDNPSCCNPSHLFLGTSRDNAVDRDKKGRGAYARRGELHHSARLTDAQVAQIRLRYSTEKETQTQLAKEFRVTQATIWRVVHHRRT